LLSVCETASGGVGRYQASLRALVARNIACRVLLAEADRPILGPNAEPDEVATYRRRRRGAAALWNLVAALLAERRARPPDLYFFNSTLALVGLLALRLRGDRTPAVYCAHCWAIATLDPASWRGRAVRALEGRLCGLADLVVNVSDSDADTARRFGYGGRHVTVQNAVPPADPDVRDDLFSRREPGDIHLLFVGRFDRQKGLDLLLPAFARARAANPHLYLHLVGGAVRDDTTPPPPPQDGVTLHGWIGPDAIDGYYRSADALVVPSRWEGLPLVVPESLRNATPVLVSRGCNLGHLPETSGAGASFELEGEGLETLLAGLVRADLAARRPAAHAVYGTHFDLERFIAEMAGHLRALAARRERSAR
jgi:glycosyltransferase involved in cell wall biosynthesis